MGEFSTISERFQPNPALPGPAAVARGAGEIAADGSADGR